jgi:hypothetical protein
MRLVKEVAECHLRGGGVYRRETIEQILHELAEKEDIHFPVSRIRKVAERALGQARGGVLLTRSALLKELKTPQ